MKLQPADNLTTLAECERLFAEVLTDVVGTEHVAVDSHFFDDLGADSMLMARFCARVRKRPDLPSVSMPDVYKHPTIRSLATVLVNTKTDSKPTPASQPATSPYLLVRGGASERGPTPCARRCSWLSLRFAAPGACFARWPHRPIRLRSGARCPAGGDVV